MKVWSFEADQIQPDDSFKQSDIVSNGAIEEFLTQNNENNKYFLVAPKGLGKTLILKLKSKSLRENTTSNYFCIPQRPLVEKISIESKSLSTEDFVLFGEFSEWKKIWKICLTLTICCNLEIDLPEVFQKKLSKARDISNILNIILDEWKFFLHRSDQVFNSEIAPLLRQINNPVAVFIDSLDQALGSQIKNRDYSYIEEDDQQSAINMWVNAQLGLLYAIYEICSQNRHIKIYASIRQEAFEMDKNDQHMQILDFTTNIQYSKEQLRRIFMINIENTDKSKLVNISERNGFKRFFGTEHLPHLFIPTFNEDVFDFIYRHTFGRPRELVLIGKKIYDIIPKNRNIQNIRETVNNVSYFDIFEQFKKEIIPFFDEKKLTGFLENLKSNIFSIEESKKLDQDLFQYYFKLGLIGCLKLNHADKSYYQDFRQAFTFNYRRSINIPNSRYFFTHPSMDNLLTNNLGKKYNQLNVIGHQYSFTFPKKNQKNGKKTICHFGVGNLGRGLTLPVIFDSGNRIILLNRLSENWNNIVKKNMREIKLSYTNEYDNISFKIIHDSLPKTEKDELISAWIENKIKHLFLLSNDESLVKKFVETADFISTALKYTNAIEWFANIINSCNFKHKVSIYPFENDRNFIAKLKSNVKDKKTFIYKEVIADRICTKYNISYSKDSAILKTFCEEYSSIIINDNRKINPFNNNRLITDYNIICTSSKKEFEFYYKRKFWLFNCVHAALSCLCYNSLRLKNVDISTWEKYSINILKDTKSIEGKIEHISKVQAIRLIIKTDSQVLFKIFHNYTNNQIFNELHQYGTQVLDRISKSPDELFRVLPLKEFAHKYDARINDIYDFYTEENIVLTKKLDILNNFSEIEEIKNTLNYLKDAVLKVSLEINKKN